MKLLYASSARFPSQLANRIQTLSMARAFQAALGDRFTLSLPARANLRGEPFRILPVPGPVKSPLLAWRNLALVRRERFTHVFCREERLLFFLLVYARLLRVDVRFVFEAHEVHADWSFRPVLRRADLVVATTEGLAREIERLGAPSRRLLTAPNGVDLSRYERVPPSGDTRRRFGLPSASFVVGYTGSVSAQGRKGLDTFLAAARSAPPGWLFWIVGGRPGEVDRLRAEYPCARFAGYVGAADVPAVQAACDVLVLPNSARADVAQPHTSPLKLFEYLASGVPIVASDLPSIREILSEREAFLFTPDDPASLVAAIATARDNSEEASARAARARDAVLGCTWERRAEEIVAAARY